MMPLSSSVSSSLHCNPSSTCRNWPTDFNTCVHILSLLSDYTQIIESSAHGKMLCQLVEMSFHHAQHIIYFFIFYLFMHAFLKLPFQISFIKSG